MIVSDVKEKVPDESNTINHLMTRKDMSRQALVLMSCKG